MKKNTTIIITGALLLLFASVYVYKEYLFKPSRNISSEVPAFQIPAGKLVEAYTSNNEKADSSYLNKTIEVSGIATKVTDSVIQIDKSLFCLFNEKIRTGIVGEKVTVKGKCIGYDELFEEVKLDQCTITK